MKVSREESSSWLVTGLGEAALIALSLEGFFFSSAVANGGLAGRVGCRGVMGMRANPRRYWPPSSCLVWLVLAGSS